MPVPSAEPNTPEPANVVTTPAGVILRTSKLAHSVTYKLPAASIAMPSGQLNRASNGFVEFVLPETPEAPAKVVTTPAGVIFRMLCPVELSATNMLPEASKQMPSGLVNRAAVPVASVYPVLPAPPTNVDHV